MNENLERLSISLPEQNNFDLAYSLAFKLAGEKLASLTDLKEQCQKSGAVLNESGRMLDLKYLTNTYSISLPDIGITQFESDKPVEIKDKIIILHYLLHSKGTPLSNKMIAFQGFEEGANYFPSFFKRSIQPLIQYFGQSPEALFELSKHLGGIRSNYGDVSVTIPAFPKIPITYILWQGDDEFPPNANILFDGNVLDYLPVEDIIVLCQTITWKLVKSSLSKI